MSRLFDQIAFEGYISDNKLRRIKSDALPEIFLIDNVADYFFERAAEHISPDKLPTSDGAPWLGWDSSDIPNVAPPFKSYWMEFAHVLDKKLWAHGKTSPLTVVDGVTWKPIGGTGIFGRVGVWTRAYEIGRDELPAHLIELSASDLHFLHYTTATNANYTSSRLSVTRHTVRWFVWHQVFVTMPHVNNRLASHWIDVLGFVNKDGATAEMIDEEGKSGDYLARLTNARVNTATSMLGTHTTSEAIRIASRTISDVSVFPCLLATTYLHCKNVSVVENAPDAKLVAARVRKQKPVPVTFKTLTIEPMTTRLSKAGADSSKTGLKKALHICRGHFMEFGAAFKHGDGTPKGKLFGKYEGRFFVPQTLKGSSQQGAIVKEYDVHTK